MMQRLVVKQVLDSVLPCLALLIVVGHVQSSLGNHYHQNASLCFDYCVIGAGPAGLQMGYFLSKAKRDYIILERNTGPASFFRKYPRHRKLISINKVNTGRQNYEFNLRHDWNSLLSDKPNLLFKRVSSEFYPPADSIILYLNMFEKELGLNVRYEVDIGRIRTVQSQAGRSYILTDQHASEYKCRVLLVATGLWVPNKISFIGSDLIEGYESMSTNADDYRNQAVLILGKGNSAFETAQNLLGKASVVHMLSANTVRLAWQTHYVGDVRAVNNDVIDTYQLKSLDGLVENNIENLAIIQQVRAVHRLLEQRYHGNPWQSTQLSATQLVSWILKRVNEASGLYQMVGILGDVIVLKGSHVEYVEEFPVQAMPVFPSISGHEISSGVIVMLLQYGTRKIDFLGKDRAEKEWAKAWKSNFLHPVLYYYQTLPTKKDMKFRPKGWPLPKPKAIHHIIENFFTEWHAPKIHIQPLRRFLEHCMQTDLRAFYAESCFSSSLTHCKPPLFCQEGYLKHHGVTRRIQPWRDSYDPVIMTVKQGASQDASEADPTFSKYLAQAGMLFSSGLKLEL
ncbi:FAD-dependent oxidoreductase domain-containing protein 2 isoform X5 [Takifugu rubripes]|uniref:FAD-dependent oxidoreductase domain-containing protein 2 isoform X5 n=1 Tax=Takifugu rubripes TaxID=31033 RepID=UPI001145BD10|nr:FAD-dependent oxidoreductase domain-containing protein 2 isoform X5 [Takifugu rubripes]